MVYQAVGYQHVLVQHGLTIYNNMTIEYLIRLYEAAKAGKNIYKVTVIDIPSGEHKITNKVDFMKESVKDIINDVDGIFSYHYEIEKD